MASELNLAARAVDILFGRRYNFLVPKESLSQETAKLTCIRAIRIFQADIRDFQPFMNGECVELFQFGPFAAYGTLFLDEHGFVLGIDGEKSVLDWQNVFLLLLSPFRICSIAEVLTERVPEILRERIAIRLAAETITDDAIQRIC